MGPHAAALHARLPWPLRGPADAAVRDFLSPAGAPDIDFTSPAGEPALVPASSVSWRVFKNPVTLFVGGVAAVLLELAEPRVRAGVWEHTSFRDDPLTRMRRTGLAAMVTVYAARSAAGAMIARVGRMHARVSGVAAEGAPYRADDPELLTWVQATAAFAFVEAYGACVRPLSPDERDRFYAEGRDAAALYGATGAPTSQVELDALFAAMRPKLSRSDVVFEFLDIVRRTPIAPWPARSLQTPLIKAAVAITPADVRAILGLDGAWLPSWPERESVRLAARAADRVVMDANPAVQACRRLGLPPDWLWRA